MKMRLLLLLLFSSLICLSLASDKGGPDPHTPKDKIKFNSELVQAAADEDFEKVKALINAGEPVDQQSRGVTALHLAITKKNLEAVKFLVEKGADVNRPNPTGEVPAQIAIINLVPDIVDYLLNLEAVDIYAKNPFDYNIMHVAAQRGDAKAAEILQSRGFNKWNDANEYQDAPLHLALKFNQFDVAWFLVKHPDVDTLHVNDAGWSPFLLACCSGDVGIVKYLKDNRGADDKQRNNDEETCLHRAIQHDHIEIGKYLIEELGHEVDPRDFAQWTPLHFTVLLGHLDAFDFLIEKGADPYAKTDNDMQLPEINERSKNTKEPKKQLVRKKLVQFFPDLADFFPDLIEGREPIYTEYPKSAETEKEDEVLIEDVDEDDVPLKDEL